MQAALHETVKSKFYRDPAECLRGLHGARLYAQVAGVGGSGQEGSRVHFLPNAQSEPKALSVFTTQTETLVRWLM